MNTAEAVALLAGRVRLPGPYDEAIDRLIGCGVILMSLGREEERFADLLAALNSVEPPRPPSQYPDVAEGREN